MHEAKQKREQTLESAQYGLEIIFNCTFNKFCCYKMSMENFLWAKKFVALYSKFEKP